jgi:hypothetical protein
VQIVVRDRRYDLENIFAEKIGGFTAVNSYCRFKNQPLVT